MAAMPSVMVPYRDVNNREIKYTLAHTPSHHQTTHYDSDAEPLISPSTSVHDWATTELDEDSLLRFTATGRPMPGFKASSLMYLSGDVYSVPQLLPKRYTDDSIIPAIIINVIPSSQAQADKGGRRSSLSFLGKFKGGKGKDAEGKGITKVVYMPRRDYLKWFARGLKGEYIGSEEYRRWTEEELEEAFGRYKPEVPVKRKASAAV